MRTKLIVSMLVVLTLGLGACGGDDDGGDADSEAAVEATTPDGTVEAFLEAAAAGDAEGACALLSADDQKTLLAGYLLSGPSVAAATEGDCIAQVESVASQPVASDTEKLTLTVEEESASEATVLAEYEGYPIKSSITLVQEGGEWRIADSVNADFVD